MGYTLTHYAPTSIAFQLSQHSMANHLTDFLQEVKDRAQYHYWLFGHCHDSRATNTKHILLWEQIVQILQAEGHKGKSDGFAALSFAAFRLRQYVGKDKEVSRRKLVNYTSIYKVSATPMKAELPEVELCFAAGWAVCAHPEKDMAVATAKHLQTNCPESEGLSSRDLRRMREFYRAYADGQGLQALVLRLGWAQNVVTSKGCEGSQERV